MCLSIRMDVYTIKKCLLTRRLVDISFRQQHKYAVRLIGSSYLSRLVRTQFVRADRFFDRFPEALG